MIYVEDISENITKYYVKGNLFQDDMDTQIKLKEYYIIINIDNENKLFDVTPYDGKIFKEN